MFKTMSEVKEANRKIGHVWFDLETMKYFWNTHIHTDLIDGKYFITSEDSYDRKSRLFSIRQVSEHGAISTLVFQQFENLSQAEKYLNEIVSDKELQDSEK